MPAFLFFVFCLTGSGQASGPEEVTPGFSLGDAIQITLENQTSIQETKELVALQEGLLQQVRGAFDRVLSMSLADTILRTPLTLLERTAAQTGHSFSENYLLQIGLARKFRSGVLIVPNLQFSGTRSSPTSRSPELLGQGGIHFTVQAPLQRGRREDLDSARERSALLDLDAAHTDVDYQTTLAVYQTIVAYWNFKAAIESLTIQLRAAERGMGRIGNLIKLVDADQIPAAEIIKAKADLADNQADILLAVEGVNQTRADLGLAMGLTYDRILALGSPTTQFHDPVPPRDLDKAEEVLINTGLEQRLDLAALQIRKQSAETLLPALRSQTRPKLDLSLDVGYNGLTEGGTVLRPAESLFQRAAGLNSTISMSYEFPLENRGAIGTLRQQKAQTTRLGLQEENLTRSIKVNIRAAFLSVSQHFQSVQKLTEVIERYQTSLENEEKKMKLGLASLFDVLNMEDRLIAAQLKKHVAQKNLALAVARLQNECGGWTFSLGKAGTISLEELFPTTRARTNPPTNSVKQVEGR